MRRRAFLTGVIGALSCATGALARDRADDILRELKRKGYRIDELGRTFLGRLRIIASKDGGRREIIVNPATGEILRDLWITRSSDDQGGKSGSGEDRGWDDDDDDDGDDHGSDHDDDDDDRGGHGGDDRGGNSGGKGGDDDD